MVRRTKEEASVTRQKILDASVDVFYENGVAKTSLNQIADAAGVTRGAVYWHFKDKGAIFSEIHASQHRSVINLLQNMQQDDTVPPLRQLEDFSIAFFAELARDDKRRRIYSLFTLKCDYSGEMSGYLADHEKNKEEGLALTENIFAKAIARGDIQVQETPRLLALSYFCYVCGICDFYLRYPRSFDLAVTAAPLLRQFFNGLIASRCEGTGWPAHS